jgi:Flp pilus assembly protein TadG
VIGSKWGQRGDVLVEFALAGMLGSLFLFAIIDFGRAIFTYNLVANGARLGTRYAMVHGSACTLAGCPAQPSDVQTYVRSKSSGVDTSSLTVSTSWAAGTNCTTSPYKGPGCLVTVTVSYPFKYILPFVKTVTMSSTSKFVISQ